MEQAKIYQQHIEEIQYKKMLLKIYRSTGGWASGGETVDGFDPQTAPVPTMDNYTHARIKQVMQKNWSDIILLAAYSLLFFIAAFVSFLRFDVR